MIIVFCLLLLSLTNVQCKVVLDIEDLEIIDNNLNNTKIENVLIVTTEIAVPKNIPKEDSAENEINKIDDTDDGTKSKVITQNNNKTELHSDIKPNDKNTELNSVTKQEDNGTALILTPLIENGQIDKARKLSEVDPELFIGVKSYSGFLTVNKTYNSNLFFWYFPIEDQPVSESPWIVWFQGGPGASSLTGLFDEIGPITFNRNLTLQRNKYSWLQNHSLVFIDNPVGTGYSFTDHKDGYARDMNTYATHMRLAITQLLELFPELKSAPLYVAGESYGGKYAPALAMELHRSKEKGLDVNLQGVIVGNGFVDPSVITQISKAFYNFGLLSQEQMLSIKPLVDAFRDDVINNRSNAAKAKWNSMISILLLLTQQKHGYNFLRDELGVGIYTLFLKKSEIKRAIHVGDIGFSYVNFTVNSMMSNEFLTSAKPLYEELLDHYRVLAYCGQLDLMLPCFLESEQFRTWRWNETDSFLSATRYPYIFNNKLYGYHKSGGHLTEVVVRGAGHMVPVDTPAPLQTLVARWTADLPLSKKPSMLGDIFLRALIRNTTKTNTTDVFL